MTAGTPAGMTAGTPAGMTAGTPAGSTPMTRPEIILSLTPDVVAGEASYVNCIACHGADAKGNATSNRLPVSDLTQEIADKMNFVNTVLNGTSGMIPYDYLEDQEIANIMGYVESLATR
jgi:mono/diheme cytochrome c family protein